MRKPTELELINILNAFCRLQFGFKSCKDCPCFNLSCEWFREKIITEEAVLFAINEWEKLRSNNEK